MKTLKYLFAFLAISASFMSCSNDDDQNPLPNDPVAGLIKIKEFSEEGHKIEVYAPTPELRVGYNEVSIKILDKSNNTYVTNAAPTWMPMMHMETMNHSAPHSMLNNSENNTVYKAHVVFQMPTNATEYWDITMDYTFNGQAKTKTHRFTVLQPADGFKKTQVFTGSDEVQYILAFVNPREPQVAINDFQAVLYKMEDAMTFPIVANYKITVDPRMPSMGNHSSPNNQDLIFNPATKMYDGKLSFSMTGFWKINMKLLNENGDVLKGEDVTEDNPQSSLYFELEF